METNIIRIEIEKLFPMAEQVCQEIIQKNQTAVGSIPIWLERQTWEDSLWNYGVPPNCFDSANSEEFDYPNYTNLLCLFSEAMSVGSYLEIGVSSGRNIYPFLQFVRSWNCVGLDIECANTILIEALNATVTAVFSNGKRPFKSISGKITQVPIERTEYFLNNSTNHFSYVQGDKFHSDTWDILPPLKFGLIFSDACHIPSSLTTELNFLIQNELLDENELVFAWDDLHQAQLEYHRKVIHRLFDLYCDKLPVAFYTVSSGTYGNRRQIGIFASDRKLIPFGLK